MSKINESMNSRISTLENGWTMVVANKDHDSFAIYKSKDGKQFVMNGVGYRHASQVLDAFNELYSDYEFVSQSEKDWM